MRGRGHVNAPTVAGLPKVSQNPAFSKDVFNMFVPKFKEFIDGNNGKKETVKNELENPITIDQMTDISFKNTQTATNTNVLNIDSDKNIILGKRTITTYKEGYQLKGEIRVENTDVFDKKCQVNFYLNDVVIFILEIDMPAETEQVVLFDERIVNSDVNSLFTVKIDTLDSIIVNKFSLSLSSLFKAADGDGAMLYEMFVTTADQKILQKVWNVDWEFAMSLCIGHYIALVNRETQVSFGLGDIAVDSEARGQVIVDAEKKRKEFKNIMLNHNETKFWNSTEYGRQLITLLYTKAIPTMMVVN